MSEPVVARENDLVIPLMEGYYSEQFQVYDSPDALKWWQVFDRTDNHEIPVEQWSYRPEHESVHLHGIQPWHLCGMVSKIS